MITISCRPFFPFSICVRVRSVSLPRARFIRLFQLVCLQQKPARGKVRRGHDLHEFFHGNLRVADLGDHGVDALAQIVRRDVGRQPDSDTAGAVDQKVRIARGQHVRLLEGIVKIQAEGNGIHIDIAQHLKRQRLHARFGISHGGGRVAVDRSKVSVPVHQLFAHAEVLRHAYQRVVNA